LKAQSRRPQITRSGLTTVPVGNVVVLAIPGGVVAVLLEHFRKRAVALGHQRVVSRETRCEFHNHAGGGGMVVTTGEQRGACWRAKGSGVELRVAQPILRQTVKG